MSNKIEVTAMTVMSDPNKQPVQKTAIFKSAGADGIEVSVFLDRAGAGKCKFQLDDLSTHDGHAPSFHENQEYPKDLLGLRMYCKRVLEQASQLLVAGGHGTETKFHALYATPEGTPSVEGPASTFNEVYPEAKVSLDTMPASISVVVE